MNHLSNFLKRASITVALAFGACSASAVTVVYSDDFDGGATFYSGVTANLSGAGVQSTQGFNGVGGFAGNFFSSYGSGGTATITLANLPAHTFVDITGLIAIIDSWDSAGHGGCCNPDYLQMFVDGVMIFSDTYNNAQGPNNNTQGLTDVAGGYVHRGFSGWVEQGFDLGTALSGISHTGSSLTFTIQGFGGGWQGLTDEAWGLDNVSFAVGNVNVPTPANFALMLLGIAGLLGSRLRRG